MWCPSWPLLQCGEMPCRVPRSRHGSSTALLRCAVVCGSDPVCGRLSMSTERVVGIGAGAAGLDPLYERGGTGSGSELATTDMVLNIGPQHPATHGVLRLRLTLDGERIVDCEPIVGYMHRGVEKLFEVRDYRQIIVLANRHDWLSAFSYELGVVLAVERMMGMEVPGPRGLGADAAGRAEPGAQPPDVPRLLPARARRDHADLLRLPRARDDPGGDGGDLRRPDALHVQPRRRPQGGPRRTAGSAARRPPRRRPHAAARDRGPHLRQRDLPGPHRRRRQCCPPS